LAAALGALLLASSALTPLCAEDAAPPANDGAALPYSYPPHPFTGKVGPTESQSVPDFHLTAPVKAPAGAPNILLILTDDVGFGASSTFGGPIATPNLDQLAQHGLRYNEFQTTAICSATRAALLTGRNHHEVGTPAVVEITSPYPGYDGIIPKSAATIARILTDNGYNTAMFGKHHNTPNEENSPAGPMDRWPLGLGFQHFYGFIGGDADQYRPNLINDNTRVEDPHRPKGYLLDKDLADHAIAWIHAQKAAAPDKPFFVYYAPGTTHAPHQAPADWIAKFRGKFDQGWDKLREETLARQKAMGIVPANTDLAPRPKQIPAWDSLSPEEKRVDARYAEVYAGMLAYEDAQIGRVLDEIKRTGLSDNTIVVFVEGDNGASAEGGPAGTLDELVGVQGYDDAKTVDHWLAQHLDIMGGPRTEEDYPAGWAFALDAPFPWFKQIASHLGGVRNGLVISWPGHIKDEGHVRTQYHHVIDITPTLLEVAQVKAPQEVDGIAQQHIDGVSMAYSFDQPNAPSPHDTQYYEMLGNRGIYHDGWLANTTPRNMPWEITQFRPGSDVTTYNWELYDLNTDYGQAHDLAAKDPGRLKDMQALFDAEATRNNAFPIQDSGATYRAARMIRATGAFRSQYVFWGKDVQLPNVSSPPIFALPFSIDARIDVPNHANGVIVASGSLFGGWSFYLKDGKPVAFASASNLPWQQSRIAASKPLAAGRNDVKFDFSPAGQGGTLTISVNGAQFARGEIRYRPRVMAGIDETFDIGRDTGVAVSDEYQDEGIFTGGIDKVEVDVALPKSGASFAPSQPREPD
jgi:arylsulfatase